MIVMSKTLTADLEEFLKEQYFRGEPALPRNVWLARIGAYFSLLSKEAKIARFEKMLYNRTIIPNWDGYRIHPYLIKTFKGKKQE